MPAVSFLRWDYIYLIIFQTRKSYLIFLVTALKIKAGPVGQVALILRDKNIILHLYLLAGVLIFLPALLWKGLITIGYKCYPVMIIFVVTRLK